MEYLIRRLSIIFILCMLAIILMFIGINYQSDKELNNTTNERIETVEKNKKKTVKKKKKEKKQEEIKKVENIEKQQEESNNDYISRVEEYKESTESNYNNNYNQPSYVSNTSAETNPTIPVSKFSSRINNNRLYVGQKERIITTIYPSNATVQDTTYTSSNPSVAIVSSTGEVTAISKGECYITINVKNANSGNLKIRVVENNNAVYKENKVNAEED